MSGSSPTPAEQHLGDRLAALVDGELNHDARERVLSHLATCAKCKAEADAQRNLKNVFAQAAPPPPSEGFLARLQGLPAGTGGDDDGSGGPFGGGRQADGFFEGFGVLTPSAGGPRDPRVPRSGGFGYLPVGSHAAALPDGLSGGFRIHEVDRSEQDRPGPGWRGRRFAFAAASAVSLAAIALGGTLPLSSTSGARAASGGSNVVPLRSSSAAPSGGSAEDRRRGGAAAGFLSAMAAQPTAPVTPGPRGLNGMPAQNGPVQPQNRPVQPLGGAFPAARLNGSSLPPLIRPAVATLPLTTTDLTAAVLAVAPSAIPKAPARSAAPVASGLPLTARR
ncbi:anti-sigma factor family protein [Streptomyces sp. NPDC001691]|uniref:anti-sigma factor family protein n=1 Tax=unclassified Streptomyces TaxID=2593676 RepID=UPI000DEB6CB0|nr:anti-sigma factor [Streptomyces sp. SDr-06]RCH66257.1 zf-HC2 domain-containing protein [Streptomyces sp. SDr-06]